MATTAIFIVIAIMGLSIAFEIHCRVFLFVVQVGLALVFVFLLVKAIIETIWGLILILSGLTIMTCEFITRAVKWISRIGSSQNRRVRLS